MHSMRDLKQEWSTFGRRGMKSKENYAFEICRNMTFVKRCRCGRLLGERALCQLGGCSVYFYVAAY